jgi:hypothetical protein
MGLSRPKIRNDGSSLVIAYPCAALWCAPASFMPPLNPDDHDPSSHLFSDSHGCFSILSSYYISNERWPTTPSKSERTSTQNFFFALVFITILVGNGKLETIMCVNFSDSMVGLVATSPSTYDVRSNERRGINLWPLGLNSWPSSPYFATTWHSRPSPVFFFPILLAS